MASIEAECVEALCCLSETVQTNEDPSSFQNSCTGLQTFDIPENDDLNSLSSSSKRKRSGGAGGYTCCVPGCFNNHKKNPELSFYSFPNGVSSEAKELRKKWINLISRKDFSPTIGHRVCSAHFPGGRKTYMNRLPTIVPKTTRPTQTNPRSTVKARNRTPLSSITGQVQVDRGRLFSKLEQEDNSVNNSFREDDFGNENVKENENVTTTLEEKVAELMAQNKKLKAENERLKVENEHQKTEIKILMNSLQEQTGGKSFSIECFKNNDKLFRFYTGLQDYSTFKTLFTSFGPTVNHLVYYGSDTNAKRIISPDVTKHGPKRSLPPEEEFFMVLVRLRLGLLEEDIAVRFCLSQAQVSRTFISWIDFLHSRLRCYPIWPSRASIDKTMPTSFKQLYPTTRVIIDCTEIFIETPSSFRSQSVTYSNYKHHNTAKGLVGISPSGAVTFVSDLYSGRSSDKQITIDCGILKLLENGDSIMADKGFDIKSDLPSGVSLNIPPFLRGKDHLSVEEETATRRIASVRIHVERAIARIKNFKILKSVFPIAMAADLNKIWVVCSYLSIFLPPLIMGQPK